MTKEAYYFSHDANARNDIKIIKLRRALGLEGYAIYFCLIEILREQKDHKLPLDSVNDIAFELHTSEEKLNVVINSFDLFLIEDSRFFSARLLRSMDGYNEKKLKLSEAGKRGNAKRWGGQGTLALPSGGDRIKEKDINKSKEEVFTETLDEFIKMRKAIKKPITEKGVELILDKLNNLSNDNMDIKISILNQSIENSWQGVFELKQNNTTQYKSDNQYYSPVSNKIDHSNRE